MAANVKEAQMEMQIKEQDRESQLTNQQEKGQIQERFAIRRENRTAAKAKPRGWNK